MRIQTFGRSIPPIVLLIGIVCDADVASAGARLYTGMIQIWVDYGSGFVNDYPVGAKFSYPKMNNLPTGDYATTIAASPIGVRIPSNQMALVTSLYARSIPGWPRWIRTTFDGRNGSGSFSPGGAPGSATSAPVTTASGTGFKVSFSGTPARFGGTMRLLASNRWAYGYSTAANWKLAFDFGAVGGEFGGKRTLMDSVFQGTGGFHTFFTQSVWGFPWTTGTVMATAPPGRFTIYNQGETARITAKGADLRTPQGNGTLQLVTPFLVRQRDSDDGELITSHAGVAIVSLRFVPEPSAIAQLVAGLSLLTLLYRFAARERRS